MRSRSQRALSLVQSRPWPHVHAGYRLVLEIGALSTLTPCAAFCGRCGGTGRAGRGRRAGNSGTRRHRYCLDCEASVARSRRADAVSPLGGVKLLVQGWRSTMPLKRWSRLMCGTCGCGQGEAGEDLHPHRRTSCRSWPWPRGMTRPRALARTQPHASGRHTHRIRTP